MTSRHRLIELLDRHGNWVLLAFLLFALALRVAALVSIAHSPYFDFLLWDERLHDSMAREILKGNIESASFFSWFLAFLYSFFTPNPLATRIANVILGTAICFAVYLVGKELAGRLTGLAACLIAALYKPLIFYSVVPLKTTLSVLLFTLAVYIIIKEKTEAQLMSSLFLGLILGVLSNIRPNCLALVPVAAFLLVWSCRPFRHPIRGAVFVVVLFTVGFSFYFAPVAAKGIFGNGSFRSPSGQAGMNLYLGNSLDNPVPYYRPVPFAQSSPFLQERQFTIEASRRLGRRVSSSQSSAYWISQIFRSALADPPLFLKKLSCKTLALFNRFEAGDHYDIDFLSSFAPFFKIPFFPFFLIFPLGFAGIIAAAGRSKGARYCLVILMLYGATLVIFFTTMRYRLPIAVILIPFAVIGIHWCISRIVERRYGWATFFITLAAVATAAEWLPLRGTDDMSAYYNTHAIVLNSAGKKDAALEYWKISSRMEKPYSAFANLSLAGQYLKENERAYSLLYLDKIEDDSFAAAAKYEILGDLLFAEKNLKNAVDAYEDSLSINSGQVGPRIKLIRIFQAANPKRALEEKAKLEYILSFYSALNEKKGTP